MTVARSKAVKFTDAHLRAEVTAHEKKDLRDHDCPGLLIRVHKSGGLAFAWAGRDASGKQQTRKLWNYPEMSLKAARERVALIRVAMRSGSKRDGVALCGEA
jgi:hypothetical protein